MLFIQSEKIGIVAKAYLVAQFLKGTIALQKIVESLQSEKNDIIPKGSAHILVEKMGQIGFVDAEYSGNIVGGEFFVKMGIQINQNVADQWVDAGL